MKNIKFQKNCKFLNEELRFVHNMATTKFNRTDTAFV